MKGTNMWLEPPYYEGKQAYREGYDRDENPYPVGDAAHQDWEDGWDDAHGEAHASEHL